MFLKLGPQPETVTLCQMTAKTGSVLGEGLPGTCFLCFGPETGRQHRTQEGEQRRSSSFLGCWGSRPGQQAQSGMIAVRGWPLRARSGGDDGQMSGSPCDCVPFGLKASWPMFTSVTGLGCATGTKNPSLAPGEGRLGPPSEGGPRMEHAHEAAGRAGEKGGRVWNEN